MTDRDDRDEDGPLDLSPWAAPAPPRGLTSRVMNAVRASADATGDLSLDETGARTPARATGRTRWQGLALGVAAAAATAAIAWAAWPRPRAYGPATGHVVAAAPSKITLGGGTVALLGAGADIAWTRSGGRLDVTHAAGDVTYQHAGPARLVINTPYAEVQTASAWLHVEVPMSQKSKVAVAGVAGAAVAAAVIIAVYEGKASVREPTASPRVVEAGTQIAVAAPTSPTRAPFTPVAKATRDRAQRDALAAAIASARAARTAGVAGGGSAMPAGTALTTGPAPGADKVDLTPGQLSKEEIRSSVREVIPLLTDCYALMVEKYPRIGGKVVAKLVVEAEPDVGTIVTMQDDSEVAMKGATDGTDPRELRTDLADFHQCLGATLETVALPPLGDMDGGRVEITYPFVFAPSEEEADQYNEKKTSTPPPADEPAVGRTAEELLAASETAAKQSQWRRALEYAEQAMGVDGVSRQTEARAAMVAALAACNTKNAGKARSYFARATPSSKTLIEQRCLANKIDVTPGDEDDGNDVKNPFDSRP